MLKEDSAGSARFAFLRATFGFAAVDGGGGCNEGGILWFDSDSSRGSADGYGTLSISIKLAFGVCQRLGLNSNTHLGEGDWVRSFS